MIIYLAIFCAFVGSTFLVSFQMAPHLRRLRKSMKLRKSKAQVLHFNSLSLLVESSRLH